MSSAEGNEEIEVNQDIQEERKDEDILTVLIATDIHLGYGEKDPIRAQDTFVTFEEILKTAKAEEVDFVLLGGDLFHETRPSTHCLYKCIELLKRYCLGDRPVQIEFLSDPTHNFSYTGIDNVNYEDPNLNIGLPIFSIHGNHDDPTGEQQISALNLLASTGFVNYFGKYNNHTSVEVEPILLRKGQTQLALYGLSHIKDERLGRLFLDKNVTFMALKNVDDWFNLLVLHQNRANRGAKTFIPDDCLPSFLDLVFWGHEHDCRITPERSSNGVFISQPGSSVATSLCIGEAIPKKIGILKVHKKLFIMKDIPLKTVRPFIFSDFILKNMDEMEENFAEESLTHQALAEKMVEAEVDDMIAKAKNLGQEGNMLPLIRLNVGYVDEKQTFNAIRFGQKYIGKVANPKDMIKLRSAIKKPINRHGHDDKDGFKSIGDFDLPNRVEDLVLQYFENNDSKQLKCLSLKAINEAVVRCIDSNDLEAPVDVANRLTRDLKKKLEAELVEIDKVEEFLRNIRDSQDEVALVDEILNDNSRKRKPSKKTVDNGDMDIEDDDTESDTSRHIAGCGNSRPARGPGSRGGRGSRGARGSRARGKACT